MIDPSIVDYKYCVSTLFISSRRSRPLLYPRLAPPHLFLFLSRCARFSSYPWFVRHSPSIAQINAMRDRAKGLGESEAKRSTERTSMMVVSILCSTLLRDHDHNGIIVDANSTHHRDVSRTIMYRIIVASCILVTNRAHPIDRRNCSLPNDADANNQIMQLSQTRNTQGRSAI